MVIFMIIFLYKTDLLCTKHCFTVCLVFDSLVDNKNCKGQVTFLWTKFLKKSYENILNLRGELTLSLHSTLTELSPWETSRSIKLIKKAIHYFYQCVIRKELAS